MQNNTEINTSVLDNLIFGRVEPQIYAFSTGTIPNYLKVGDTYRPLETRLVEWKKHFPDLEKKFQSLAKINDDVYFRDHAVHFFLEKELSKLRLQRGDFANLPYFSDEFFKNTNAQDLEKAIKDILSCSERNDPKYQLYRFVNSRVPITHKYKRTEQYEPRPNQQETIDNFKKAVSNGRSNLLMYAVMRFGKSFTSMCCACEMNAKLVLVVSAKADVKEEWKKTVESHIKFGKYTFCDSNSLLQNNKIVSEKISVGEGVVLFLTLQDLQGDKIKSKHKDMFSNKVDLLLIDETHFGARAEEYGKILKDQKLTKKQIKNELELNDSSIEEIEIVSKSIESKIRIHLSGTPYRILMNSEFAPEDIIAFYQFSDIADDQSDWDEKNLNKDSVKEWHNPYYGFPQMIRFAFNPNESSRKKMDEMEKSGVSYAFSELFRTQSIVKDSNKNLHKQFIHEQEVLDLLKVIDGSKKDKNILNFLDYKKIKDGNMCRHLVFVLPFRASCDALEKLINTNNFKNLNKYKIINISGVDNEQMYKDIQSVQSKISGYEKDGTKTITLTVNRMLTGSTVPEWDTMFYLKDTSSAQEYDQAVFRLQNQYIKTFIEPGGDSVKFNMKPQTLLIDFSPNRMFQMQEKKSQIYNVNTDSNGNSRLEDRIKKELEISPIVVINKNKITQITPTNILDAIREYSNTRSVIDEATSISVDFSLLDIELIKSEIEKQGELGSRQGIAVRPAEGKGDEFSLGEEKSTNNNNDNGGNLVNKKNKTGEDYKKKFAMYYARILFFAFLTNSNVRSLNDLIESISKNTNNIRISGNLSLETKILTLFQKYINPFVLRELDYKIHNVNSLSNDLTLEPVERAGNALKKFTRLSSSEIVTPEFIAKQIVDMFPKNSITETTRILDTASKQGEFVYSIYKKYGKKIANNFYSIPTSEVAYEFTRKVYELLELTVDNIESSYTSYDLIRKDVNQNGNNLQINKKPMKFDVIVGNPPYQVSDGGAQASAKPIYNEFVNIAKKLDPKYISIIMPTRWYAGGKGLDLFRDEMLNDKHISELHDFLKPELLFRGVNLRGGVCYYLWNKNYDNTKDLTRVFTYMDSLVPVVNTRRLKTVGSDILIRHALAVEIFKKIKTHKNFKSFEDHVSSRRPFNLDGNLIKNSKSYKSSIEGLSDPVACYGKGKKIGYIERSKITKNTAWIEGIKVFAPYANNIGTELSDDNLNTFIGEPGTVCTETYIVIGADLELNKSSAQNLSKYFETKFARFMHSISKVSQHGTSKTYKLVPIQNFTNKSDIDWSKSISEIDQQLYSKYNLAENEKKFIEDHVKPMA